MVVSLAFHFFYEWLFVRASSSSTSQVPNEHSTTWSPPPHGSIKSNMDAAIFKDKNSFGIGLYLHDEFGSFIKARTQLIPDCKLMKDSFESARFGQNVLLSRCRSFIASISNSYVSFIKRQVNYVVHNLARASQLHASSHDFICIPTYDFVLVKKKA
ncbi:hypothetical protein JHK82_037029 [Glycine max]|uniref:RNase H type-1 domain-containing protein n=1 Tax=Glycine max TaxID=3847 RepID=K7M189_SOYBN|nr:hypothetical protein JHK87_036975 [Glycine soja]KAG4971363.1 hypothetical protein JHK85_037784 [Glycine max]KAG4977758.1 hypothetical protein JHK86_037232 [Glycine max]KAG5113760.1 hypothetical protein JHK82_037029 [Glycine max]KAG5131040.1 hypothetical protein JHK84_037437 [Glycine max]